MYKGFDPCNRVLGDRLLLLCYHLRRVRCVQLVRPLRHGRPRPQGHHVPRRRQLPRPGRLILLPQRLPLLLRLRSPRTRGRHLVVGAGELPLEM